MEQKLLHLRQALPALKAIISLIAIVVFSANILQSQCLMFTTQDQVDSFPINYPNYSTIDGWVEIYGSDITNLDSLIQVESITQRLYIENMDNLISIEGLKNISHIGTDIWITGNPLLSSLEGLNNIDSCHYLFMISGNDAITDVSDLESLVYANNLSISDNASLTSMNGLESLDTIAGNLGISYNPILNNIEALDNLSKIGGILTLSHNNNLENLHGLEGLRSIGLDLRIHNCTSLSTLSGLDSLTSIGGDLSIYENNSLQTLSGIDNIEAESIMNLSITYNPQLSTCEVQSVCDYLANPNGDIQIYVNATGCNNSVEVEEACTVGIPESLIGSQLSTYPNPFTTSTAIEFELTESTQVILTIYTHMGQVVEEIVDMRLSPGSYTYTWTTEGLPQGLYYAVMRSEDGVAVIKMIKQ